jgi:hypothetical protein
MNRLRMKSGHLRLRARFELLEHEDSADIGVQTVADGDVDEAVPPADGHRGLEAMLRHREEARAPIATEDECEHVAVHGHGEGTCDIDGSRMMRVV